MRIALRYFWIGASNEQGGAYRRFNSSGLSVDVKNELEGGNVVINDLNTLVISYIDRFIRNGNIHLSDNGKRARAKQTAYYIKNI